MADFLLKHLLKIWIFLSTIFGLTFWIVDPKTLQVHTTISNILLPFSNFALYLAVEWISYLQTLNAIDMIKVFGNDIAEVAQTLTDFVAFIRTPSMFFGIIILSLWKKKLYQSLVLVHKKLDLLQASKHKLPVFSSILQLLLCLANLVVFIWSSIVWVDFNLKFELETTVVSFFVVPTLRSIYKLLTIYDFIINLAWINMYFKTVQDSLVELQLKFEFKPSFKHKIKYLE